MDVLGLESFPDDEHVGTLCALPKKQGAYPVVSELSL